MKKLLLLSIILLLFVAACSAAQVEGLQTLVAAIPGPDNGPLGGQVAALPTAVATEEAATPPPSVIDLSADSTPEGPPVPAPLATMTAMAYDFTPADINATPYAVAYEGRPHFIEFQAWW